MDRDAARFSTTVVLTALSIIGFAANSLLCRISLGKQLIDPPSFTSIRVLSGALTLTILVSLTKKERPSDFSEESSWIPGILLFAYASAFSFAYVSLDTGTGALILFGAVQTTMLSHAIWSGEELNLRQWFGFALAIGGLACLLIPGSTAPSLLGATVMCLSGFAWGMYSIRGRSVTSPTVATTTNFRRAAIPALICSAVTLQSSHVSLRGIYYAVLSGSAASAVVYVLWYRALRNLSASQASFVQLLVPVLAAAGGIVVLSEEISMRLIGASATILLGVALAAFTNHHG